MSRTTSLITALSLAVSSPLACLGACTSDDEPKEVRSALARDLHPAASDADLAALVAGDNALAADLYRQVRTRPGNLFFSPHSIATALRMLYPGAAGNTATQMASALHFTLPGPALGVAANRLDLELASRARSAKDVRPFRLRTANSIWNQDGLAIEQPFLDTLAVDYDAGVHVLDFKGATEASRKTINDWVASATDDKIRDLLTPGSIAPITALVLTNAIYFSAAWDTAFEADATAPRPFTTAEGVRDVPTLHQSAPGQYGEGPGFRAAALPYDGGALAMVVVMPEAAADATGDPLAAFEAGLTGDRLTAIVTSLHAAELTITLPKFEYDASLSLREALVALGMVDAFSSHDANFSGIDGQRDLYVDAALHKAFIGVDEKGTEAAAATAVTLVPTSAPESRTLTVDRPFLYFILDQPTGAILFVGRVVDPS